MCELFAVLLAAPYSFFNAVAEAPPMLAFSSRGAKDSSSFAAEAQEFVWNLVTYDLREAMNETSAGPGDYTLVEHIFEMLRPQS